MKVVIGFPGIVLLIVVTIGALFTGWVIGTNSSDLPPTHSHSKLPPAPGGTGESLEAASDQNGTNQREPGWPIAASRPIAWQRIEDPRTRLARLRARMEEYAIEGEWAQVYSSFSADALLQEQAAIDEAITDAVWDEFEKRFESGNYQVVSIDGTYKDKDYNPYDVCFVRSFDNGVYWKSVLPDEDFEDIYKLRAQSAWLFAAAANKRKAPANN